MNSLGKLLRDRYYCGVVVYDGEEYPGRHEAIISEELFQRVQSVLFGERRAGTRRRVHNHYLKGLLWCARCNRRLIISPGRSKTGEQYFYFRCRGRQERTCDLPPIPVAKLEASVVAHYATVPIPPELRAKIRQRVDDAATVSSTISGQLRRDVTQQLAVLDKKEDNYLDLVGDPDWPQQKLRERLKAVRQQQAVLRRQLEAPETDFDSGRALMLSTIELLGQPQELYRQADDTGRKLLNKAIFDRLHIDHDGDAGYITGDTLNEPFSTVVTYNRERRPRTLYKRSETQNSTQDGVLSAVPADRPLVAMLDAALRERSSSRTTMVELRGIEPRSSSVDPGLLRVQSMEAIFSAPALAQTRRRQAQSGLSPDHPS